jgi:uridylate kinase
MSTMAPVGSGGAGRGGRRILLKISGESLSGIGGFGIEPEEVRHIATQVARAVSAGGLELAMVVGGGNFLRGEQVSKQGIERTTADFMGMLATIMNALALQAALESLAIQTRVQSAIHVADVAEPFIRRRAIRHLEKGRVVIFAGGIGNPYFSTDTTAALRAVEVGAGLILKATKVKGIYTEDPLKNPAARFYEEVSFQEVLQKRLKVMDSAAIILCMDNHTPIRVFDMAPEGNIEKALRGETIGTLVRD